MPNFFMAGDRMLRSHPPCSRKGKSITGRMHRASGAYWDGCRPGAEEVEAEWCERYKLLTQKLWASAEKNKRRGTHEEDQLAEAGK